MKLLALLAVALSLLSASPADARHHHRGWQAQHGAVPMPRERPSNMARPDGGMRHAAAPATAVKVEPVGFVSATGTKTTEARLIELGQQHLYWHIFFWTR